MQDFTGVPAVVDLSAMRDAMKKMGGDKKSMARMMQGMDPSMLPPEMKNFGKK